MWGKKFATTKQAGRSKIDGRKIGECNKPQGTASQGA
jgi:hypothetical protein